MKYMFLLFLFLGSCQFVGDALMSPEEMMAKQNPEHEVCYRVRGTQDHFCLRYYVK